ncbi:DAZ-associated protein 1 isoform X7 [Polyodon spathula]|uniref:DAZ-associated protein 1 isoform X7 n=1 Tax=Polyodon spathula TaxID=7913 RepID=UPI001B7F30D7|nr:DAZ-associated protein 1 isoform X7 [Polyodon spathula]
MNNSLAGDEIGKLFVGGLDWSTTQETLRNYFCQYGEVVDCVIMKDKTTNQSRGFGFVKFNDPNCVRTVLETKPHSLDGRNIDPKPCTPRGTQPEKTRTKEGWVTEVVMIYDAEKQRPRGFGFITFEAEQSVDQAVNMHFHDIMGKKVEVKRAEPRDSKTPGPGEPGANQWGPRAMLSAANGWAAQPAQGWQQGYAPQVLGMWMSAGQPIGGYGPSPPAGRGVPPPPPSPFNAFLVTTTPPGGYGAPQGYPQPGYGTPPQYGYGFGAHQNPADQFAPQGVPQPPTTPGAAPMGFAPATTPTQDMNKPQAGQPEFSYNQFGLGNYPQDPSGYGPTRPSQSYGQAEQGYSAGYGQDMGVFGQSFTDPSQQAPSYGAPSAPASGGPQLGGSSFGRGQNHNVQGFHPYRR